MGAFHANHLFHCPQAKLYCVVDTHRPSAEAVADQYDAKVYGEVDEALNDPEVDAVLIATSTDTHADLIIRAAKAGKPIFCEKPIDLSLDKIEGCIKVLEETGVPFLLGFNRRFDPSIQGLKQQLKQNRVGKIEQISIISRDRDLPSREFLERSGGLFRDMTIHDFDMAAWLLEEKLVEVYAAGGCLIDPTLEEIGDIDTANLILKAESGALVQISNSRHSEFGYDQRIEAFGALGMLRARNLTPTTLTISSSQGVSRDCPHPSFPERYREAYQIEIDHFIKEVVIEGKPPLIGANEGRRAIIIANAAFKSLNNNSPNSINY